MAEQAARKQGGGYTQTPVCRDGSWEGDYYGDVAAAWRHLVIKHRYNAFHKTDLDTILRANGVRTIVVTGVSTNVCVESTVRKASSTTTMSCLCATAPPLIRTKSTI